MAQTWTDNCYDPTHTGQVDLQAIENNFACLKTTFLGSGSPTSTPGQLWMDSGNHLLKIRNAIDTAWIEIFDVGNGEVPDISVDTDAIQDGAVTNAKLAAGAVSSTKIATDAVTEDKIEDGAVTGSKLGSDVPLIGGFVILRSTTNQSFSWAGDWVTVSLSELYDTDNLCSMSGSKFTLQPGIYVIEFNCTFYPGLTSNTYVQLYNHTDVAVEQQWGSFVIAAANYGAVSLAYYIDIDVATEFSFRVREYATNCINNLRLEHNLTLIKVSD